MVRTAYALLGLAACLFLGNAQTAKADERTRKTGAPQSAGDAAREVAQAWREGADAFRTLVVRPLPDRFEVIVRLAVDASNADRSKLLQAVGEALEPVELLEGAAACARAWTRASDEAVAAERVLLKQLEALDPALGGLVGPTIAQALASLADIPQPESPSVAGPLLVMLRARLLLMSGRAPEAFELTAPLQRHAAERRWDRLAADAAFVRAQCHQVARRRIEAADTYELAAVIARRIGNESREWMALQSAVILRLHLGDLAHRYALGLRMHEIAKRRAPVPEQLGTEAWVLDCEYRLGALARAAERAQRMIDDARAISATGIRRAAQNVLLGVRTRQGRFVEALDLAAAIRAEMAEMSPHDGARAAVSVAQLYAELGRTDDALAICRDALAKAPTERALAMTAFGSLLGQIAGLLRSAGRRDEARAQHELAVGIYRKHQQVGRLLQSFTALADHHIEDGRLAEAREIMDEVTALAETMDRRRQAAAHALRGRLELVSGNAEAALAAFEAALTARRDLAPHPVVDARLIASRGRAQMALGRYTAALDSLRKGTALLLQVATGLGERHALGLRDRTHGMAAHGFEAAVQLAQKDAAKQAAHLSTAWWFREAGRALLLADTIRNSDAAAREQLTPEDRVAEESALKRLTRAQVDLVAAEAGAAKRFLEALEEYSEVARRVDRSARKDGSARTRLVFLDDFRDWLPHATVALAYAETSDSLYGLCVRKSSVHARKLAPRAEMHRLVGAWRDLASAPGGPTTKLGARLYDILVRPFEGQLTDARSLLVLPDGPLAYLPFGALVSKRAQDGTPAAYLLDRMPISYVPSGTVYHALRHVPGEREKSRGLLAVGDPAYAAARAGPFRVHAPLEGTRAEIEAITPLYPEEHRHVLLGEDATLEGWNAALLRSGDEPWRCIHLACHGLVDPERPRMSGLVFAGGTVLSVEQLHRRRIPCDLVVLSACETASGTYRRGEGVIGLVRGFFQSGAASVAATAWPVSDTATAKLMLAFHRSWTAGVKTSEALRRARLALRTSAGPYAHPYYWAPFVLWGP